MARIAAGINLIRIVAAVGAAAFFAPAHAAVEACRLLAPAEITSALGAAPTGRKALDPSTDPGLGAKLWTCEQQVGRMFLSINVIELGSPAAAAQVMTRMIQEARDIPGSIKLNAAPGPGERAASGASAEGAIWVVLKGNNILNVTLAGEVVDPPRILESLKGLATLAQGRL